jgi:murein peptide amidase A
MDFLRNKPGFSVEGVEINSFRGRPSDCQIHHFLYLMAGVHGDEVEGVYLLEQLYTWLKETSEVHIPIILIPILNPDGHRARMRTNSHGVDLNRNLPSSDWTKEFNEKKYNPGPKALSEPENQYLLKLFKKYPPFFVMSFHSWKPAINYNGNCQHVADFLASYNNYPVLSDIGYPTPGSLGNYLPEVSNTPVITFECPPIKQRKSLKEIWDENKEGLIELLKSDLFVAP